MSSAVINIATRGQAQRHSLVAQAARIALASCLRHWCFWVWGWSCLIAGGMAADGRGHGAGGTWIALSFFTGFISAVILLERFFTPGNQLVPRYRETQLAAMALGAGGMFALLTAWIALLAFDFPLADSPAAVLAWALGLSAIPRLTLLFVVYGFFFLLVASEVLQQVFFRLVESQLVGGLCFAAAALVLVRFGRWLATLDEDAPLYDRCRVIVATARCVLRAPRRHAWVQPGLPDGAGALRPALPTLATYRLQDWLLELGLRHGRRLPGWQVWRWDLAWPQMLLAGPGMLLCMWAPILPLVVVIYQYVGWGDAKPVLVAGLVATGMLLPIVVLITSLVRRWSMLGFESLRPVSRERALWQWGAALASRMGASMLASALFFALAYWSSGPEPKVPYFALGCLFFAALVTYTALLTLLRTVRADGLRIVAWVAGSILYFWLLMGLLAALLLATDFFELSNGPFVLAAAVGVGLGGALILRKAYRRWLVIDLD